MWMPQPRGQMCVVEAFTPYENRAARGRYPAGYARSQVTARAEKKVRVSAT
jgi:hypothetical protein